MLDAAVVTSDEMPATVCIASVASVPSSMSASVAMSPEIDAKVLPSARVALSSTLPVVSLKPTSLPLRVSASGSSNCGLTSELGAEIERLALSLLSAAIAVRVSSCVLSAARLMSTPVTKSDVLSMAMLREITTVDPPDAPVTDIVIVPVDPSPPLTV